MHWLSYDIKLNSCKNKELCKWIDWLLVFNAQSTMTVISGRNLMKHLKVGRCNQEMGMTPLPPHSLQKKKDWWKESISYASLLPTCTVQSLPVLPDKHPPLTQRLWKHPPQHSNIKGSSLVRAIKDFASSRLKSTHFPSWISGLGARECRTYWALFSFLFFFLTLYYPFQEIWAAFPG